MRNAHSTAKSKSRVSASPLMVRLDEESKQCLAEAAELRHISVSDYVRVVTIPQARREVRAAQENMIAMTAEEQMSFWTALSKPPKLTAAQRRLGAIMRGDG
jgi:uncharacterized protein (DUF1778 family)